MHSVSPARYIFISFSVKLAQFSQCEWISVSQDNLFSLQQTKANYSHLNGQLFVGPAGNDSRLAYNFRWAAKSRKNTSPLAIESSKNSPDEPTAWAWAGLNRSQSQGSGIFFASPVWESMQGNWFDFCFHISCFLFPLLQLLLAVRVIVGVPASCDQFIYFFFGSQHPLWVLRLTCKWFAALILCNKRFALASNTRIYSRAISRQSPLNTWQTPQFTPANLIEKTLNTRFCLRFVCFCLSLAEKIRIV